MNQLSLRSPSRVPWTVVPNKALSLSLSLSVPYRTPSKFSVRQKGGFTRTPHSVTVPALQWAGPVCVCLCVYSCIYVCKYVLTQARTSQTMPAPPGLWAPSAHRSLSPPFPLNPSPPARARALSLPPSLSLSLSLPPSRPRSLSICARTHAHAHTHT
jgi:hypothetical protein